MEEIPSNLFKNIIKLVDFLFYDLNFKKTIIKSYTITYFIKTFKNLLDDPYYQFFKITSCFHLASKVCEESKHLSKYVESIENGLYNYRIRPIIFEIAPLNKIKFNFFDIISKSIISFEMEIIQSLQFQFKIKLPTDFLNEYINKILRWHLKEGTEIFNDLKYELQYQTKKFSNDLLHSLIYYQNEPEIIAYSLIKLSLLILNINIPNLKNYEWSNFLLSNLNQILINEIFLKIKDFFFSSFNKNNFKFPKNLLEKWIIIPYKTNFLIEEFCKPPPENILNKINIKINIFSTNCISKIPNLKPPPLL